MAQLRPIDDTELFDSTIDRAQAGIRVAMPGVVRSFDPDNVTCVVEIATFSRHDEVPEGSTSFDRLQPQEGNYPILLDVPVVFPRGGGCTLTFPIQTGDECLVIFADRCIDFWWQNGDVQSRSRERMHDYSDAFVIPGPQSQAKKISDISTTGAQLRTDDGAAFVEVAAGGDITATTTGAMTINAPTITLNGAVTINGPLTQGKGAAGGGATLLGPLAVDNDVSASGISLTTHTHTGVQAGSGNTGAPQ